MSTPNGFDPRWVEAINGVLEDRESDIRIKDITECLWDEYLGPMIDMIEADAEHRGDLPPDELLVDYQ